MSCGAVNFSLWYSSPVVTNLAPCDASLRKTLLKQTETGFWDSSMEKVIVVESLLKNVLIMCPALAGAAPTVDADEYVLGVVVILARIRDPLPNCDLSMLCL